MPGRVRREQKHRKDVSNFDKQFTSEKLDLTPTDKLFMMNLDQNEFFGFSFLNPEFVQHGFRIRLRGNIHIVCPEVEELAFLDFLWDEDEDEFVCSVNNHELLLQMIENKNGDAEPVISNYSLAIK
ncbi:hypothetical protein DAPPUDRAFT_254659 [Daphnia pulex]|uniref:AGC-kinase C-terminal domain-containing protein n=1 Tax=Daphnia pulex TaxID=6669 RepID=E9H7K3_DAPPU|nr:hypothetical protein DAPPUDRAFT_254659 [Daphnia pulex]|eukprot:EFX72295.1 hypothetical protein DAPPUDRAFT_254659 [Daphnia pulex]